MFVQIYAEKTTLFPHPFAGEGSAAVRGGGQRRTVTCAARHRKFIIKPTDKSCGCGVKIIDTAVQSPETVFQNLIKSGKHVCEELVPRIPSSSS